MKKLLPLLTALLASTGFAELRETADTPAGTRIENTASVDYNNDDGTPTTLSSNTVVAIVRHVPAISITPNSAANGVCGQTTTGIPGQLAALPYVLENSSNGDDTYTITAPAGSTLYSDSNNNGTFENGTDTPWDGTAALKRGETKTFFVVRQMPALNAEAGGTVTQFNPSGVSQEDTTVSDTDNLGCIVTQNIINLTLTPNQTAQSTSPGSATLTHTLTNTGNVPLNADNTILESSSNNASFTSKFSTDGGSSSFNTLQEAFNAFGNLAPNNSVTITDIDSVASGVQRSTQGVITLNAYSNTQNNETTENQIPQASQATATDTINVISGIGNITKTQALCTFTTGTNFTCGPQSTADITPAPCQPIRYEINAQNTGDALLKSARVRDVIPENIQVYNVIPLDTADNAYIKIDQGNWLQTNNYIDNLYPGQTIQMAYDTNKDGNYDPTTDGYLPGNTNYGMAIIAYPIGNNCPLNLTSGGGG